MVVDSFRLYLYKDWRIYLENIINYGDNKKDQINKFVDPNFCSDNEVMFFVMNFVVA